MRWEYLNRKIFTGLKNAWRTQKIDGKAGISEKTEIKKKSFKIRRHPVKLSNVDEKTHMDCKMDFQSDKNTCIRIKVA